MRLGSAPVGVYSDDGDLIGVLSPDGDVMPLIRMYPNYTFMLAAGAAGKLTKGFAYTAQDTGSDYKWNGTALIAKDGYPAIRNVAGRCAIPTGYIAGQGKFSSRAILIAAENLSIIALELPNYCATFAGTNTTETINTTAILSLRVSIEYPLGTTPTVFDIAANQTLSVPAGDKLRTDFKPLPVMIPRGARFGFKSYGTTSSGVVFAGGGSNAVASDLEGDWYVYGSGSVDHTGDTTNPSTMASGASYRPTAVLSASSNPSYYLLGDSLETGNGGGSDNYDASLHKGLFARAVGPYFAYCSAGVPSDRAYLFAAGNNTNRLATAANHTVALTNYGNNDINNGQIAAQLAASITAIAALLPIPL